MDKILVIGSSNTDLITTVKRLPGAGETIQGKFFFQAMGGKGANQALAAHRSGGNVSFITCLGSDSNGKNTLQYYKEEGLDVSSALIVDHVPSGTAVILVNDEGENCIVVTPGANHELSAEYIHTLEKAIAAARYVVLQMEIPLATVTKVCELAKKHDTQVVLNVAPAVEISKSLIEMSDILVLNESEIEIVSGSKIEEEGEHKIIDTLLSQGAKTVILTLGSKGCIVKSKDTNQHIPAFQVKAVDTTAAGDTFCGSLVARLSKGDSMIEAVKFATTAAAICVTRLGAQPSIPTEQEVYDFQNNKLLMTNANGSSDSNVKIV